jgi:hypothetical protein
MVRLFARKEIHVQSQAGLMCKGPKKLLDQVDVKRAGLALLDLDTIGEKGSVGDVYDDPAHCLVHGDDRMPVSPDSFLLSEGLAKGFSKANPDVFNGVVMIDFRIPSGVQLQVQEPVSSHKGEHVIHKWDPRVDFGRTFSSETQGELNVRLFRFSFYSRSSLHGMRPVMR